MSIATDEAEQWAQSRYFGSSHIERHDGHAVSVQNYPQKVRLRAEGYVAGRTAEPTEEEVKAVADELAAWNFDVAMNSGATIHGASADFNSRSFELLAKRVLNAARKAVTESQEREL
jgi:alkanesulfonate monooxygenase SsuD/methylene tetrahydromethanopterin reductase-like flavin-dependent oxidoreductase (luciferase family)